MVNLNVLIEKETYGKFDAVKSLVASCDLTKQNSLMIKMIKADGSTFGISVTDTEAIEFAHALIKIASR